MRSVAASTICPFSENEPRPSRSASAFAARTSRPGELRLVGGEDLVGDREPDRGGCTTCRRTRAPAPSGRSGGSRPGPENRRTGRRWRAPRPRAPRPGCAAAGSPSGDRDSPSSQRSGMPIAASGIRTEAAKSPGPKTRASTRGLAAAIASQWASPAALSIWSPARSSFDARRRASSDARMVATVWTSSGRPTFGDDDQVDQTLRRPRSPRPGRGRTRGYRAH